MAKQFSLIAILVVLAVAGILAAYACYDVGWAYLDLSGKEFNVGLWLVCMEYNDEIDCHGFDEYDGIEDFVRATRDLMITCFVLTCVSVLLGFYHLYRTSKYHTPSSSALVATVFLTAFGAGILSAIAAAVFGTHYEDGLMFPGFALGSSFYTNIAASALLFIGSLAFIIHNKSTEQQQVHPNGQVIHHTQATVISNYPGQQQAPGYFYGNPVQQPYGGYSQPAYPPYPIYGNQPDATAVSSYPPQYSQIYDPQANNNYNPQSTSFGSAQPYAPPPPAVYK